LLRLKAKERRSADFSFVSKREKPPRAIIHSLEFAILDPAGYKGFEIRYSDESGAKSVLILPDIATCPDCLRETFDPGDRRYRIRSPTARIAAHASRSSRPCHTTAPILQ
jgi:hydrogenase maturation protein HypF